MGKWVAVACNFGGFAGVADAVRVQKGGKRDTSDLLSSSSLRGLAVFDEDGSRNVGSFAVDRLAPRLRTLAASICQARRQIRPFSAEEQLDALV